MLSIRMAAAVVVIGLATAVQAQQTTTYQYDVHGRLIEAASSAGRSTTYAYDPANNRTAVTTSSSAPNTINWANASTSTTGTINAVLTNYQSVTGISAPITLRFAVAYSGTLTAGSFNVYSATRSSFLGTIPLGSGQVDILVNPNESLNLYADGASPAGPGIGTWTVTVTNRSAGGAAIDTTVMSAAINVPG